MCHHVPWFDLAALSGVEGIVGSSTDPGSSFYQTLNIDKTEFHLFVLYGEIAWYGLNKPYWVELLCRAPDMEYFLLKTIKQLPIFNKHTHRSTCLLKLLTVFLTEYLTVVESFGFSLTKKRQGLSKSTLNKAMRYPFRKCVMCCFRYLGVNISHPLIRMTRETPHTMLILRKGVVDPPIPRPCKVAPPSQRRIGDCLTNPGESDPVDNALRDALRECVSSIPCGNPFRSMTRALCLNMLWGTRSICIPLDIAKTFTTWDITRRFLASNILWPFITLPVFHEKIIDRIKEKTSVQQAVSCLECGHCLNFGRGKFLNVNFQPTNIFYCRDQKEKQFSICASSGRIYCSFCGCSNLHIWPLFFTYSRREVYIRAVLANNAVRAIQNPLQELDIVLPCLGNKSCDSCVLKRVTVCDLIYLTGRSCNIVCIKCSASI
ncbi:UL49-like protein [Saguinine gammaherpesvirus 1]|uniref:UL49-like protein n=1 Tax=Saguinine gammaherpesvirus 1 TaxID=2169901 RepID=A0A9Q8QWR3_9GAMA|nr:UL49-like protein [Saguinine gammaherpesvirus 1]